VRPTEVDLSTRRPSADRRPANRWSVRLNLRFSFTDQGVDVDRPRPILGILIASGCPEIFD
jgi:hypothetical protein